MMKREKLQKLRKKLNQIFIKTSTGFGTGGATVEDVKLMKSVVGDEVKVKAAGGIRDLKSSIGHDRGRGREIRNKCRSSNC